jgi:hypothetical protein
MFDREKKKMCVVNGARPTVWQLVKSLDALMSIHGERERATCAPDGDRHSTEDSERLGARTVHTHTHTARRPVSLPPTHTHTQQSRPLLLEAHGVYIVSLYRDSLRPLDAPTQKT